MVDDDNSLVDTSLSLLGHTFSHEHRDLVKQVRTRAGYAKERVDAGQHCRSQESLAVLGDGVLRAILTELLIERGFEDKGLITIERRKMERNSKLASIAESHGLQKDDLYLTKTEMNDWRTAKTKILSDTLEAFIGAIHLSSGYARSKSVVEGWFAEHIQNLEVDR